MKIEQYTKHTVVWENDIMHYYIFAPNHRLQITIYNDGKFKDTIFPVTDLAKYSSTEHFNILVLAYCIPNNKK